MEALLSLYALNTGIKSINPVDLLHRVEILMEQRTKVSHKHLWLSVLKLFEGIIFFPPTLILHSFIHLLELLHYICFIPS